MGNRERLERRTDPGKNGRHDYFDTRYIEHNLKGRTVRGGAVTIVAQGCRFALHLGSVVVLARLLTPSDFGLIAMVTAVLNFVTVSSDLGLTMATIQKPDIDHNQVSTLFWINTGIGLLLSLLVAALAPAVAAFYREPRLTTITIALGGTIFLHGLVAQHGALLRRHLRFFAVSLVTVIGEAVAVAAAICAALLGAGYWSLVVLQVVPAVVMLVGIWIAVPWRPGLPRKGTGVRSMITFGGNLTGFNFVNYFANNTDNVLIGRFIGPAALGLYARAYNLMLMPVGQLIRPVTSVVTPSLSRLVGDPERYRRYYTRMDLLLAAVIMPAGGFIAAMGNELILFMLGPQWEAAGAMFRVFGIAMIALPPSYMNGTLFVSQGRGRDMFRWSWISTGIIVTSIVLGLRWGAFGVAVSFTLATVAVQTPLQFWYVGRSGPVSQRDIWGTVWQPMAVSVGLGGFLGILRQFTDGWTVLARLGAASASSLVLLGLALAVLPFGSVVLQEVKQIPKHLLHS